jgi:hypothetical protein
MDLIKIEEDRVRFNGGQFDSDFRYVQTAPSGTNAALLEGPSIALSDDTLSPGNWRFQVGSYTIVCAPSFLPTPPASVPNTPTNVTI